MESVIMFVVDLLNGVGFGGPKPGPRMALANRIAKYAALIAVAVDGIWVIYMVLR